MGWYYEKNGNQIGPISEARLRQLIQSHVLGASSLVWRSGYETWIRVSEAYPDCFPSHALENGAIDHECRVPELSNGCNSESDPRATVRANYFVRHWRGQLTLGVSYWVNFVLGNAVTIAATFGLAWLVSEFKGNYGAVIFWVGIYLASAATLLWQATGVWRSADAHILKTQKKFWANAAKVCVMVGLLRFLSDFTGAGLPAIRESIAQWGWLDQNAKWEIIIQSGGAEVEVRGGIGHGIASDFERILKAAPSVKLVRLNLGAGGLIGEATEMSQIISARGLSTYTSGECVSACTIAFMGGNQRYLRTSAKLGFHSYKIPGVSTSEANFETEKRLLIANGASPGFVERIFQTPHTTMWFPTLQEMVDGGVVTAVVRGP